MKWFCCWFCIGIFLAASARGADVALTLDSKALPATPGYHVFFASAALGGKQRKIACGICLPPVYFSKSAGPLPIVVTLHNRGINGSDGRNDLIFEGLAMLVASEHPDDRGTGEMPDHALNLHHDAGFITLIPQCPAGYGWENPEIPPLLDKLITQIARAYHADEDRTFLTGFSYGGSSTWQVAVQTPGRYAAIAPVDGRATSAPAATAKALRDVGIYLAVGAEDNDFLPEADRMNQALMAEGNANFTFRRVPQGNHWGYAAVYTDPDFWRWMLRHHRQGAAARKSSWPDDLPVAVQEREHRGNPATMPSGGGVLCLYWRDMPGDTIKGLTDDPAYPKFPTEQMFYDQLEIPANQAPRFGSVLCGWVHPPVTGDYTFFIASDNQGELFLSSDSSPGKAGKIAAVPTWCLPRNFSADPRQKSKPMHLIAGRQYYLEARQKSGGGDNNLSVAWQLPDGKMEAPIPGSRLSAPPLLPVPPPSVSLASPASLPRTPGLSRISLIVDFLGRQQPVEVWLLLPNNYDGKKPAPALVYLTDGEHPESADAAAPTDGPAKILAGDQALHAWSPLVVISPQCPDGQHWQTQASQRITAAVVDWLVQKLTVDRQRIYCTGSLSGATALWRIVPLLSIPPAAIVPFCTMQVKDADLPRKLDGTEVHIITGVSNGLATDCAHRMCDVLAGIHPAPDIVFEMKMGSEAAEEYFTKQDFYRWLLQWRRPPGQAAEKPQHR